MRESDESLCSSLPTIHGGNVQPILQLVHMCTPTPVLLRRASCFSKGFSVGDKVSSWNSKGFKQNNKTFQSPHIWPSPHPLSRAHLGPKSLTMTGERAQGMGNDSELTHDGIAGVWGHSNQSSFTTTQTRHLWGLNTCLQIVAGNKRQAWGPRWRVC